MPMDFYFHVYSRVDYTAGSGCERAMAGVPLKKQSHTGSNEFVFALQLVANFWDEMSTVTPET